jgi:RNA polymerase sigma factor (TIGR02999 family)
MSSPQEVTQLIEACGSGDQEAFNKLFPLVYDELHRIAAAYMSRERPDHTLQTTALVHEAYLRLVGQRNMRWQSRVHFFAVAAKVMRHILVDHARRHQYAKRGGGEPPLSLEEAAVFSDEQAANVVALDEALNDLAAFDQRKSRLVELRFFGGLTIEEAAEALKISPNTAMRDWSTAKAWLYRAVSGGSSFEPGALAES